MYLTLHRFLANYKAVEQLYSNFVLNTYKNKNNKHIYS